MLGGGVGDCVIHRGGQSLEELAITLDVAGNGVARRIGHAA